MTIWLCSVISVLRLALQL